MDALQHAQKITQSSNSVLECSGRLVLLFAVMHRRSVGYSEFCCCCCVVVVACIVYALAEYCNS